jgi:hypothetical protein
MTLLRAIKAIQHSILHIDSLIPHGDCLHTEKTQKHLWEELSRIKSIQQSLNTFRDMKEWWNNHTPYRALCTHGEPLGPNLFHESFIDVVETITRWERVCDRLNIHKKKT